LSLVKCLRDDWFLSASLPVGLVKTYLKVVLVDILILIALYYVVADQQSRVSYAASPHGHTSVGYSVSFGYSLFTQIFTMSGPGVTLSSPPTLDWIQVLVFALVLLNGWFLYSVYRGRSRAPASQPPV
jgi:hypothetical protein